jgi:Cu/Ag efflux pump CusA
MPVFTLEQQEGRLFKPLAFTKTYAMAAAAILAVTIVPVLIGFFVRGKIRGEEDNPITKILIKIYHPVVNFVIDKRWWVIGSAALIVGVSYIPYSKLGSEFMPPLYEGDLLYMPTTLPGISVTKAKETASADGQNHQIFSGGRIGFRKSRKSRDGYRSRASLDDRDYDTAQTGRGVAPRNDTGKARR